MHLISTIFWQNQSGDKSPHSKFGVLPRVQVTQKAAEVETLGELRTSQLGSMLH
jgi:hypothetical protein